MAKSAVMIIYLFIALLFVSALNSFCIYFHISRVSYSYLWYKHARTKQEQYHYSHFIIDNMCVLHGFVGLQTT